MSKFIEKLRRSMAGRNGLDELNKFILVIYLLLFIVSFFYKSQVLGIVELIIILIWFFRFYSRNGFSRQRENILFMKLFAPIRNLWRKLFSGVHFPKKKAKTIKTVKYKNKHKQSKPKLDKKHTYVTCPNCKASIIVRRIKGERYILCRSCHEEVKIKV